MLRKTKAGSSLYAEFQPKHAVTREQKQEAKNWLGEVRKSPETASKSGNSSQMSEKANIFGAKMLAKRSNKYNREFAEAITQTDEEITYFAAEFLTKPEDAKPIISVISNKPIISYADKVKEWAVVEKKVKKMEAVKKLNNELMEDLDELDELLKLMSKSSTLDLCASVKK